MSFVSSFARPSFAAGDLLKVRIDIKLKFHTLLFLFRFSTIYVDFFYTKVASFLAKADILLYKLISELLLHVFPPNNAHSLFVQRCQKLTEPWPWVTRLRNW